MPSSNKKIYFGGFTFVVWDSVYEPAEDTLLFAENLNVPRGSVVLDVGTGCGILGLLTAEKARCVVVTDVNPHAILCARENARLNNLDKNTFFVRGDLFSPIRKDMEFDFILFNAPYLPVVAKEPFSWLDRAWSGGVNGRQVIDRFIELAPEHLKSQGQILVLQSSLADVDETVSALRERSLVVDVVAKSELPFFETIVLLRARRRMQQTQIS